MGFFISSNLESSHDWGTIISSSGAVLVGVLAIWFSYRQFKKTLDAKKEEERRQDTYQKLNEFYGPLLQLRKKSNLLYEKFRAYYISSNPNFSTLTYLLAGNTISDGNQKVLLDEIIKLGEACEKLIHEKSGLIDDDILRNTTIPKVTTHFLILRLAYKNALQGDVGQYQDLIFPRDFDTQIENRVKALEASLL